LPGGAGIGGVEDPLEVGPVEVVDVGDDGVELALAPVPPRLFLGEGRAVVTRFAAQTTARPID